MHVTSLFADLANTWKHALSDENNDKLT